MRAKYLQKPASKLRAVCKLVFLFFIMAPILFSLRCLVYPISFFSEQTDRKIRRYLLHTWSKIFVIVSGIEVHIEGKIPEVPCFIVANHISYIDTLLLHYATKCIFVARGDVEHWPVIGFVAKKLYIIFIDRSNRLDTKRVNEEIKHALKMGDGVAVFAESRISCGKDVQPFRPALLSAPVECNMPVHYASITYEAIDGTPPISYFVAWWRPEPFTYHLLRLLGYRGFKARVIFGEQPIYGTDRKELANQLWQNVRKNFIPIQ